MYVNGRNGVCVRVKNQVFENRETNKVDTNGRFDSIRFTSNGTRRNERKRGMKRTNGTVWFETERNGMAYE